MEQGRIHYSKLPGRRRGFVVGSSVWLAPDHLLLVKSWRFREDYKRFYFRDIQAIVTADAPRFHISTRAAVIGAIWLLVMIVAAERAFVVARSQALFWSLGGAGLLLAGLWGYVSARCSCRCRILTAVSSEELRSVYRTWTARRFLQRVEPLITQAQGAVEGDWAEAVDERQVGPTAEGRVGLHMPETPAPFPSPAPWTTTLSTCFVGSLCAGGLLELSTLRMGNQLGRGILLAILLVQLSAAVAVLIQNYVGRLRAPLRNLAITALVAVGAWYYAVQIGVGMAVAYQNAQSKKTNVFAPQTQSWTAFEYPLARGSAGTITLLLGLAGVILSLRGERPAEEKVSFNV